MTRTHRTPLNRPPGPPPQAAARAGTPPTGPALPPPGDTGPLGPDARRREVARMLAAAVVRLQTHRGTRPGPRGELSESSPAALESPPSSATHVTVREAANPQPEDRP